MAETTSTRKRRSAAGAQLGEAPAVEAEREENPARGKARRSADRGSETGLSRKPTRPSSDSSRPPVKVGGPRSYGWKDMPDNLSLLVFLNPPRTRQEAGGSGRQRDSGEAVLQHVPKALSAEPSSGDPSLWGFFCPYSLFQGSGQ